MKGKQGLWVVNVKDKPFDNLGVIGLYVGVFYGVWLSANMAETLIIGAIGVSR